MKTITDHMKYANAIAVKMYKVLKTRKYEFEDFLQQSYEGMLCAINTYNPDKGTSLDTWIYYNAEAKIYEMLNNDSGECSTYIRRKYSPKYTISSKLVAHQKVSDIIDESIYDLDEAQKRLTRKQSRVIMFIRKGYSQSEIARMFGESKQGINQTYFGALAKLKKIMRVAV